MTIGVVLRGQASQMLGTCREILKRREALWIFVHVEGVEPTNNTEEREIRLGVQWRKGSFGTQSDTASHFVESIMTVVATLRQQQRNVLEYLPTAHTRSGNGAGDYATGQSRTLDQ